MNATEQIAEAATRAGWHHHLTDNGSRLAGVYIKDDVMLLVRYRLFGAPVNYMCRFYGKDPGSGVNWGIESAHVKTRVDKAPAELWLTTAIFEGAKKKNQVLAYLRESADGHEDD